MKYAKEVRETSKKEIVIFFRIFLCPVAERIRILDEKDFVNAYGGYTYGTIDSLSR